MSASIELQKAARQLMEAACAAASAEWMSDAELKADLIAEAERDIETARNAIENAAPMLRRLGVPPGHDKSIISDKTLEAHAMAEAGLIGG